MKKTSLTFVVLLLAIWLTGSLERQTTAQTASGARTERLLKQIKAKYQPFQGKNSFIVMYAGKEMPEISVIVVETGSAAVIMADVASGREVDLTSDVMRKLLEFNSRADYIKAGISNIGSIRVQSEQRIDLINASAFEEILDQIAAGADEVAGTLKPVRQSATLPGK